MSGGDIDIAIVIVIKNHHGLATDADPAQARAGTGGRGGVFVSGGHDGSEEPPSMRRTVRGVHFVLAMSTGNPSQRKSVTLHTRACIVVSHPDHTQVRTYPRAKQ